MSTNDSPTPRTDAEMFIQDMCCSDKVVSPDFARTLERALRHLYNETLCLKTVENEKLFEAFNEAEKALGIRL